MNKMFLAFICILAISLLILGGCKSKEQAPTEQPAAPVEPVVAPAAPEEPAASAEQPLTQPSISEARCVDSRIEAVLTNTGSASAVLGKDFKIILNGLVVIDPECDKMTLAAGESTYCKDISGHYTIREGKVNTVQINAFSERAFEDIDCAEASE
jgi:hypothetical protein